MNDYIIRATAANDQIRAFAAVTTEMVETAREHHNTSPVATAALGRLLTAGAMMGSMMKGEKDVLTLQIKAGGPLQGITVTADSQGNVKGYVGNPDVCIPANSKGKLDVAGAVGPGFLTVIKDMGLKEPYSGQVMLQTCEIAEDLTYYFATSEQVPSAVGLGVLMNKNNTVRQAGGFIVQLNAICRGRCDFQVRAERTEDQLCYQPVRGGTYPRRVCWRKCWKALTCRSTRKWTPASTAIAPRSE